MILVDQLEVLGTSVRITKELSLSFGSEYTYMMYISECLKSIYFDMYLFGLIQYIKIHG